jgi:hypothetical protein
MHRLARYDPYVRQEKRKAELEERDRVLRLIRARKERARRKDEAVFEALAELEQAVRQEHQR